MRLGLAVFGTLVVVSCRSSVEPDQGRFACADSGECGSGYECKSQLGGGGLCFTLGECAQAEQCNQKDDDCNGAVDDSLVGCFPPEADCANGLDDDSDGATDCLDADCDGRACFSGLLCSLSACPGPG